MQFPDITLDSSYVAQTEYSSDTVKIIQLSDDVEGKNLRAFCQLGDNNSAKYWVTVVSGDDYTVDWTNDDVVNAVKAYFITE